jgi:hypothetical protein
MLPVDFEVSIERVDHFHDVLDATDLASMLYFCWMR